MGTRGLYGFRKDGVDKTSYNHFDSYPECLGRNVLGFCARTSLQEMYNIFNRVEMINERGAPTNEQIKFCEENGLVDLTVSNGSENDWYCLLRSIQGNLEAVKRLVGTTGKAYMPDNQSFICDSCWCEYAYIINLDSGKLEFYLGFQKNPQRGNRYGEAPDENGYYPCRLTLEIPLERITEQTTESFVQQMKDADPEE